MQDEDLCLVEYKTFRSANDVELPHASLCFEDPFDEHKLNVLGTTTEAYREHLAGKGLNDSLTNINYKDVVFKFGDYYNGTYLSYKDGTQGNVVGGVVTSRITAFYYGMFMICYGIDINHPRIHDVFYAGHSFSRDTLLQDFMSSRKIFAVVHYPNQIVLASNVKLVSFDINGTYGEDIGIAISKAEVVKRRNKATDPCVVQWRNWNELALSKYIVDIGCVPPYLEKHETFPICSTMGELKRWSNIISTMKNQQDYLPCQQMPRIDYDFGTDDIDKNKEILTFSIGYPDQVKIITQSRAVNYEALIGNIGGYIGLFLGIFI